jgi:hypothetical protein
VTILSLAPLLLAAALGGSPAVEVQSTSGEPATGTLVELNAKQAALDTAKGRVTLELSQITGITVKESQPAAPPQPTVWLELADGSSLSGTAYTVAGGKARLVVSPDRTFEIPIGEIAWVRMQPSTDAIARQWAHILAQEAKTDLLVSKKGESIDYHKGILGDMNEETAAFDLDGEKLNVKRPKIYGLVYHRAAGREMPESVCSIAETGGLTWAARTIAVADNEVRWTTPTGVQVVRPLAALSRIDFSRGKVVYLSDLKADSVEWVPYFSIGKELPTRAAFYAPRMDRSLGGGPLQLDGQRYKKGVAIHSRTTMVYRLPDRFRRFSALAGIDERVHPRGNVRLVIHGDERELLNVTVAGTEKAKPIDLDVTGVRRLTILVDFGDDLDVADHLDLCEARLTK